MDAAILTAVQSSIQLDKPLVVFITADDTPGDAEERPLRKLASALKNDKKVGNLISKRGVYLKLVRGTPAFANFDQLFKVQEEDDCLYIVQRSTVLDIIKGSDGGELLERLSKVLETQTQGTQGAQQPVVTPPDQTSARDRDVAAAQTALVQQKKKAQEEKERIRRLVEGDKAERKSKIAGRSNEDGAEPSRKESASPLSSLKATRSPAGTSGCALAIRSFDGVSHKHLFATTDTLSDVRKWIDMQQHDANLGYIFHQSFPEKHTFTESEELESLQNLGLAPSATIILKPQYNSVEAYASRRSQFFPQWLDSVLKLIVGEEGYGTWIVKWIQGWFQHLTGANNEAVDSERQQRGSDDDRLTYNGNHVVLDSKKDDQD